MLYHFAWVVLSLTAALPAAAVTDTDQPAPAFIKHDFEILHADSRQGLHKRHDGPHLFVKRDAVSVQLVNQQTFYLVQLEIGSNKDKVGVLLDTGSSDLWISASDVACRRSSSSSNVLLRNVQESGLYPGESDDEDDSLYKRHVGMCHSGDVLLGEEWSPNVKRHPSLHHFGDIVVGKKWSPNDKRDVKLGEEWGGVDNTIDGAHQKAAVSRSSGSGPNTCTQYGSFNTEASLSFKRNALAPAFNILYADQLGARGIWGTDTVIVGNTSVSALLMAVANSTSSNVGVLGVGLMTLETTYHSTGTVPYTYENLPFRMKSQGLIRKALYSLYLGKASSQSGVILFGAIDSAKYTGQLMTVPVVSTSSLSSAKPMRLLVALNNFSLEGSSGNVSVLSNTYAALLDLGTTFSYLPELLLTKLGDTLGARYLSTLSAYLMDCKVDSKAFVVLTFSGQRIQVPLLDLIAQYSTLGCFLLILPLTSSYLVLGDNILRSMYLVYDLEDYEIAIAQASYSTDENIQAVTSTIPSALRAPGFLSSIIVGLASEGPATGLFTTAVYTCGPLRLSRCKSAALSLAMSLPKWATLMVGAVVASLMLA